MWDRACPLCFIKLSRGSILARSDELICPSCHSALELSRSTRVLAALVGLVAAYLAAHSTALALPRGAWFAAVVAATVAYGVGSALCLYFLSDLAVRPRPAPTAFPQNHG